MLTICEECGENRGNTASFMKQFMAYMKRKDWHEISLNLAIYFSILACGWILG